MIAVQIIAQLPESLQTVTGFFTKGGLFMWPLLLCSIVALTTIILRTFALREKNVLPLVVESEMERLVPGASAERLARIVRSRSAVEPFPIKGGKLYLYTHRTGGVGALALAAFGKCRYRPDTRAPRNGAAREGPRLAGSNHRYRAAHRIDRHGLGFDSRLREPRLERRLRGRKTDRAWNFRGA